MLRQPDGESVYRRVQQRPAPPPPGLPGLRHAPSRSTGRRSSAGRTRSPPSTASPPWSTRSRSSAPVPAAADRDLRHPLRYRRAVPSQPHRRGSHRSACVVVSRAPWSLPSPAGRGRSRSSPRTGARRRGRRAAASLRPVAHRGASAAAPENTIPAFRAALRSGVTQLDTDVRFTASGVPVLMHDKTGRPDDRRRRARSSAHDPGRRCARSTPAPGSRPSSRACGCRPSTRPSSSRRTRGARLQVELKVRPTEQQARRLPEPHPLARRCCSGSA